jgi:hypothetical protein
MSVGWSDEVDEILGGDLAAGFAYLTPAKGVVVTPMAPLGLRDREKGTVTLSTSLGLWKKLDRIRRRPGVAVAYHAREHSLTDRPGYVLVQGRASFDPTPDREWLESITPQWNEFLGPRSTGLVGRMLDVYYWQRVAIVVEVERVIAYPDDAASEVPEIFGSDPPSQPEPQEEPKGGTGPRVDGAKIAGKVDSLPHTLLGWCGSDDLPRVVPVYGAEATEQGLRLDLPPGSAPAGGRRAGLTAHWFAPRMIGQEQRICTGWMTSDDPASALYAPHTKAGYRVPPSKAAMTAGCAFIGRGIKGARKAGLAPSS